MDNKKAIIFICISVTIVIAGVIVYVEMNKTPPKKIQPPNTPPVAPKVSTTTAVSGFPIQQGATGSLVTNLQNGLNQYSGINISVDGNFGALTAAAVNQSGHSVPVSQSDYNDIIAPPDASNEVFDPTTGALPQTSNDADAVLLDPNATQDQITAAQNIQSQSNSASTPFGNF